MIETPCRWDRKVALLSASKLKTWSKIDRVGAEDAADHPAIETDWPSRSVWSRWTGRFLLAFSPGVAASFSSQAESTEQQKHKKEKLHESPLRSSEWSR